jgi:hypothetical protein
MKDNLDDDLNAFVNILGLVMFSLIVAFHYMTASPDDLKQ